MKIAPLKIRREDVYIKQVLKINLLGQGGKVKGVKQLDWNYEKYDGAYEKYKGNNLWPGPDPEPCQMVDDNEDIEPVNDEDQAKKQKVNADFGEKRVYKIEVFH